MLDTNALTDIEASDDAQPLLQVQNLKKYFPIEKGFLKRTVGNVRAVDDVSFEIGAGETFGLVGESGCGKTTLGRCIIRALDPTEGRTLLRLPDRTVDLAAMSQKELSSVRQHMHMIFQDPFQSLDPRMTVLDIVAEPIRCNGVAKGSDVTDRVSELLDVVGLETRHMNRYPHAFSGGQRQRIGIARSLAANPKLIVCDEAVSALDVSVQAQILNLLRELQAEFDVAYLFVSHDLSVVEHVSDRVGVMYVGKMVETASTIDLFTTPQHPYTEALLSAVPTTDLDAKRDRIILSGEVPNPADPPPGCSFHPRCPYAQPKCAVETPEWREVKPGHFAACHFSEELELRGVG